MDGRRGWLRVACHMQVRGRLQRMGMGVPFGPINRLEAGGLGSLGTGLG